MKRKRIALFMALAMTVTSLPANSLMVSAAEETDGFIAGDEISAEVESSEDTADGFAVEEAAPDAGGAGADAFESADAEDGFTSDEGAAGAESDFQATEEPQETENLVSPESIDVNYNTDHWPNVKLYDRVELTSEAYSTDGSALTYQWYECDWDKNFEDKVPIEGATGSVLVIESAVQSKLYYCVTTDADGLSQYEHYGVRVKTIALENSEDEDNRYEDVSVKVHEQKALKSAAYSLLGKDLKYQWSKWNAEKDDYEVIEGADQATYVMEDVAAKGIYCCRISDDNYECHEYFNVSVDSGLRYEDEDNSGLWEEIEAGESKTLKTTIIADEGVALSYQWYQWKSNGETEEWVEISGATGAEFTTGALIRSVRYKCIVADPYENNLDEYFNINVKSLQIEGETEQNIKVDLNATVELKVSASSKLTDKLTYQWFRRNEEGDGEEIEGNKDKASLKVENITKNAEYYCRVSDGNEEQYVNFNLKIDSGLKIDYSATQTEFDVDYDGSVTMEVIAKAKPGVELTYQWYVCDDEEDEQIIPGVNQNNYTIENIKENQSYACRVTDGYGNRFIISFEIHVRRIFVGATGRRLTIDPGEALELSVSATSVTGEALSYQWYKANEEGSYKPLEGENAEKLATGSLWGDANYYCRIKDSKSTEEVWFHVEIDSCIVFKETETYKEGKVGSKVVLDAEAVSETGVNLTYQWYVETWKYDEFENEYFELEPIQGAASPTCEVEVQNSEKTYRCKVTGSNGATAEQQFTVRRSSSLSGGQTKTMTVKLGENVNLTTDITGAQGEELTYQWFRVVDEDENEYVSVNGANTASYKVENVTKETSYYCEVSNGKDWRQQYFYINPESGFVIDTDEIQPIVVKTGTENVQLKVSAKSNYDLSYEWYFRNNNDEDVWTRITDANGSIYTVKRVEKQSVSYRCKVSDGYNSAYVWFDVYGQPDISFSSIKNVWVPKGTAATLSANAVAGANCKKMTYKWYQFTPNGDSMWTELANGDKSSYTTDAINELRRYCCDVADDYGSVSTIEIVVGPQELKEKTAAEPETAITLTAGKRTRVSTQLAGMYKYYKFVPGRSGIWQFQAMSSMSTYASLYDAQMNELTSSNVDGYYYRSFNVQYSLEKGKTYYLKCGRNDSYSTKSFLMEASFVKEDVHKHVWNAGTVKTAATCAKAGTKVYTCTGCGQTKEETIPATGKHNMVTKIDKAATCGAAGSQHKECSVCGKKDAATAIPATGKHSFGEYTVTKAPTVLAAGVKTRTCKVCGKTETAVVAKLNGTIKVVSAKVPLQLKKKVALGKLVTEFTTGDSINAAACTSSKPSIAVISGGNVVAKKAGTTVITVKLASGASAQVTVVVQKKAVATSSITVPSTVNLTTGEKLKLTPVVSPVTSLNKVSYTSTNKKVATVTKNGVITAKKSGTATIKVKSGKKTKNVKVKVAKKAPTGMTGVPATKTLKKGKSFTIKAKLTPSGAEATIKYSSSNKKIATVNSKGKVTAKKAGTVTITVKAGNVTKTCVVTVKK